MISSKKCFKRRANKPSLFCLKKLKNLSIHLNLHKFIQEKVLLCLSIDKYCLINRLILIQLLFINLNINTLSIFCLQICIYECIYLYLYFPLDKVNNMKPTHSFWISTFRIALLLFIINMVRRGKVFSPPTSLNSRKK